MEPLNAFFNRCIDVALVVATRLAELPSAFILAAIVLGVSVVFVFKRLRQQATGRRESLGRRYVRAMVTTLGMGIVLHLTQRTDLLLRETRELQYYARSTAVGSSTRRLAASPTLRLIDEEETRAQLEGSLGSIDLAASQLADGVELARFHSGGPRPITAWVTVTDLSLPAIRIHITEELSEKRLTSSFGLDHDCVVAINGEAGMSPARDAPLGSYVGTWIADGTLLHGPRVGRPYLAFDCFNGARYFRGSGATAPPMDTVNAIWGRGDLLIDGAVVSNPNPRWNQANPRTLMGIDATGTRLTLAVVDGRQQGYSLGADLEAAASIMRAFGADDAMWCDQGGSSSMYLGCMQGIINRPSDGNERPTYTHFGVSLR